MKILKEFKEFAYKGNVVDMAVGVIMGLAFGKIVNSVVNDIIMPPIGLLLKGVDFKELKYVLKSGIGSDEVAIKYGNFIQNLIEFVIVAFAVFILIRLLNSLRKKKEDAVKPEEPTKQELLLGEIRDLLRK